jgi:hypothetical protein
MPLQTNSTGVEYVYNNLQGAVASSVSGNTNAVQAVPVVQQFEYQSAAQLTGKQPGGTAFRQPTNSYFTAPNNTNAAAVLLTAPEVAISRLNGAFTKTGAFIVVTSGTNAVTVPLTNTSTNTNSAAGDNVFAKYNMIFLWNLTPADGVNSAAMTVGPAGTNGNKLGLNATNSTINLDGGPSCAILISTNGVAINAANAAITVTPTAGGTFGCVVCGG